VVILGTAGTKDQAPLDDESFEVWAVSPYVSYPGVVSSNVDVLFEMHPVRYWGIPEITERLVSFDGPVVMQDHFEDIPNSVSYPIADVEEVFKIPAMGDDLYVTNTISYMVALAALMGYEEYHLYGVHMSHNTEYGYQKPNCEYYLGYLAALGKRIVIPAGGEILRTPYLYGYNEPWKDISALKHDSERFENDAAECDRQIRELEHKKWKAEGMREYAKMIAHVKGAY
jgi:hypothetical protein